MTPAARISAAIEVLDQIAAGASAHKALSGWGRRSRYAGSGDRAALRDLVFDVLRCWRSCAALGGGETGRNLMLGALRARGESPDDIFNGEGHAPAPLSPAERAAGREPVGAAALDLPDWLWTEFQKQLGERAEAVALTLRERAPVMLRVNLRRGDLAEAIGSLAGEGIETESDPIATTALRVTRGARRLSASQAFLSGLVEVQDGSSQAAMESLSVRQNLRMLDYCAGGGGKVLALAARHEGQWFAHDIEPARMIDLPIRARRAGVTIEILEKRELLHRGPYDLVLCDVPCSGSGTWRRNPEAKWAFSADRLRKLGQIQASILEEAAPLVARGGSLVYSTCSVLPVENREIAAAFCSGRAGWRIVAEKCWSISASGDGFFLAVIERDR